MFIKEAIKVITDHDVSRQELAITLKVTPGMVSHYLTNDNDPSLKVAARIWGIYGLQVEPFTDKALSAKWEELSDDTKTTSD